MRKWRLILVAVVFLATGCASRASLITTGLDIRLGSDNSTSSLTANLINVYESSDPSTTLQLTIAPRTEILRQLDGGIIDAAILLHPPGSTTLTSVPIGYELLVIVTHYDVGVSNLSRSEVRSMFEGQILNWQDIGGADVPIIPIIFPFDYSSWITFQQIDFGNISTMSSAQLAFTTEQMIDMISATPGSFGLMPYSSVVTEVQVVALEGIVPSLEIDRAQNYPYQTAVVFVTIGEPSSDTRYLLDWLLGNEGQSVIDRYIIGLYE